MANELTGLLDGGAETLMTSWFETNQLTELSGVIVIAGLYITGLAMIGIMLGSFISAPQK